MAPLGAKYEEALCQFGSTNGVPNAEIGAFWPILAHFRHIFGLHWPPEGQQGRFGVKNIFGVPLADQPLSCTSTVLVNFPEKG